MEMSWGLMTPGERQEQANRRKALSRANIDLDLAAKELAPWRQNSPQIPALSDLNSKLDLLKDRFQVKSSPPNSTISAVILVTEHEEKMKELREILEREMEEMKVNMQEEMSNRMRQFEMALESANKDQRDFYEKRLNQAENHERRARDLSIEVEKMRLNEEILLKSYESLKKQYESALKELTNTNNRLKEEISTVRHNSMIDFAQETDRVRADLEVLRSQLDTQKSDYERQNDTMSLLKLQLASAEMTIKKLEESEGKMRDDANRYRDAEYQNRSLEIALGEEKRRKEQLERDYNTVTVALGRLRGEVRTEVEGELRPEIDRLQSENLRIRSEYEAKIQSLRGELQIQTNEQYAAAQATETQVRNSMQVELQALKKENAMWREKTVTLVSKYYSVLKSLKKDHERLKSDTEVALQRLKADNDTYKAALTQLRKSKKPKTKSN